MNVATSIDKQSSFSFKKIFVSFIKECKRCRLLLMSLVPDVLLNNIMFIYRLGYIPHTQHPRSLNEKLCNKKLFDRDPIQIISADRMQVRDYVTQKVSDLRFARLLWHGTVLDYHTWEQLPQEFVLKANHGSGLIYFVDKNVDTREVIQDRMDKLLQVDYAGYAREWFYDHVESAIIIEEKLDTGNGIPPDYKFWCCNGRVQFVHIDLDRFGTHTRNLYDRDFNQLDVLLKFSKGEVIDKPAQYNRAVDIAETIASDFDFIRVDLYLLDDGIYFGELTNTPSAGHSLFKPRSFDFEVGSKLQLNDYRRDLK